MKSNPPSLLYNADNPPKTMEYHSQSKNPYLKAILSGTATLKSQDTDVSTNNSDYVAALRYIKDSAFVRKLFPEKMSS